MWKESFLNGPQPKLGAHGTYVAYGASMLVKRSVKIIYYTI